MMGNVIAIDGPAGSGKSTVSRNVSAALGFVHLDTGAIYRSLALRANQLGVDWEDESALADLAASMPIRFEKGENGQLVFVEDQNFTAAIRTPEISKGASVVSRHPAVRASLLTLQRRIGESHNCVVEGRDTGTVVFPNATLKIFLDASPEERARRRLGDLKKVDPSANFETVLKEMIARDRADTERAASPLKPAKDAIILDTTNLSLNEVVETVIRKYHATQNT